MHRSIVAAALALCTLIMALEPSRAFENKTDRPGSDYTNFEISVPKGGTIVPTATFCEARCKNDFRCVAWTLVDPGFQGPNARCWLKNNIPAKRSCSFCTSGAFPQRHLNKSF